MSPKVSVIIPIYNSGKYLKQCLDSVSNQDLSDIEILCIDDGSIDKSPDILDEVARNDERFIVIHQQNQGAAAARNLGIRKAQGKYIIFMDSDDYYPDNDVLSALYNAAEKYNVKAAGGVFGEIDDKGNIRSGSDFKEASLYGNDFSKEEIITYKDWQFDYGFQRFLFDRKTVTDGDFSFPNLAFFEDPPFLVKFLSAIKEFVSIPKVSYIYRVGHKENKWDRKKTLDLQNGLFTNLAFARNNGYRKLYNLTLFRLTEEYRDAFDYHKKILAELNENAYKKQYLFGRCNNNSYKKVIEVFDPERGREACSLSYKIGMGITFVPRKIVKLIRTMTAR
jgi:glycosyltransferase involved in cell wall biosynthesis